MKAVYSTEEIQSSLKKVVEAVLAYTSAGSSTERLQQLQKLSFRDSCEQVIFQLLNSYIVKSETVSPGSPEVFISALKNPESLEEKFESVKRFNSRNLEQLLSAFSTEKTQPLISTALDLAGLKGKIVLSSGSSNGNRDIVELSSGSFFSDLFSAISLTKGSKFLNAKAVCIDGFIESVSEIHRILETAAQDKETIVLFVRGLSDDVVHTLKVNYDRGTLALIPVVIKYDLLGSNLLNDIAVACGCDVVSSLKGQLISTIDISALPRVESIDVTQTGVLIENSRTNGDVISHIRYLQQKIVESENAASKEILEKRIQNLGMNRVLISLIDDHNKNKKSFEIDRCLRAVKMASTHGTVEWRGKVLPFASIEAGKFYAKKFFETLHPLGAIVI